ncbi:MAG: site-2 protease family protein [Planctomycetota bacterium]
MLLQEPGRTDFDLNFSFLGFAVRVSPFFFVWPVLFSRNMTPDGVNPGIGILLVVLVFFVSILLHEVGHGLAFRKFGIPSYLVLYWMGGLAVPGTGNVWGRQGYRPLNSNQQIIVSLAGPAANLLIVIVAVLFAKGIGGTIFISYLWNVIPMPIPELQNTALAGSDTARMLLISLIFLNIFWAVFNLLPVYPLDGGQVARAFLVKMDSHNGLRNSLILSVGTGAIVAVFSFLGREVFVALLFGYLAWMSYQQLNSFQSPRW